VQVEGEEARWRGRVLEYRRALREEVAGFEEEGWRVAAASLFADRQVSVLLVRDGDARGEGGSR
jgi:hypothetical protein